MNENKGDSTSLTLNLPSFIASKYQLDVYYKHLTNTCMGSITGGIFFCFMLWPHSDHAWLTVWFLSLLLVSVVRMTLSYFYQRRTHIEDAQLNNWLWGALIMTCFAAMLWGMIGFHYSESLPTGIQQSLLLLLIIVAISSIPAHGAILLFYLISSIGILAPTAFIMLFNIGGYSIFYASLLVVICVSLNLVARYYNRVITEQAVAEPALQMRYNNLEGEHADLIGLFEEKHQQETLANAIYSRIINTQAAPITGVTSLIKPIDEFSGDYINWCEGPDGQLSLIIADITGHGMPAAMCVIPLASTFGAMCQKGFEPGFILKELNNKLSERLATEQFCCASLIVFDRTRKNIAVWNGGMPDMFILNQRGIVKERISSTHLPLGINHEIDDVTFRHFTLADGDAVFAYTDGIIEAQNTERQIFGLERLLFSLSHNAQNASLITSIMQEVEAHVGGAPQHDDIGMLHVRF